MPPMVRLYVKKKLQLDRLIVGQREMLALGNVGLNSIKARVARAIGVNDQPAPPLKMRKRVRWSKSQNKWVEYGDATFGWARIKQKRGLKPIRDLHGTGLMMSNKPKPGALRQRKQKLKDVGHLMDQIKVAAVSENMARIEEPTTRAGRIKARAHKDMLGLSPMNIREVHAAAKRVLHVLISKWGGATFYDKSRNNP